MLRLVLSSSNKCIGCDRCSTFRRGNFHNNIVGVQVLVVDRFEFDSDLKFVGSDFTIVRHDLEWKIDVLSDPVAHELKGSIRRDEGN